MRRWLAGGAVAVTLGAVGLAGFVVAGATADDPDAADDPTPPPTTEVSSTAAERRDLSRTETFDGTLGHGATTPLALSAAGTLTALPIVGTVLTTGQVLAEVDGNPVVVIDAPLPFWRTMGPGVTDGKDVLQLEYVLASLGYAERFDVTVDGEWTSTTTDAVEAFQAEHGQIVDGSVELGELVVVSGPSRIDRVGGALGQPAGEAGIELTAPTRVVDIDVPVEDLELVAAGATVGVELPDGEVRQGTVASIGATEVAEDGSATVPVAIVVDGMDVVPDGTPVEVIVDIVAAEAALTVPVEAVLALAEGGYAVEVLDGPGRRLVAVELGVFADGMVAVDGDVAEGDQVVVP